LKKEKIYNWKKTTTTVNRRNNFVEIISLTALLVILIACNSAENHASGNQNAAPTALPTNQSEVSSTTKPSSLCSAETCIEVKLRDEKGSGAYIYSPAEFTFKVGETVNFVMTSETELHTFTVDDLNIDEEVDAGETVEFIFKFKKAGVFTLICIPHETQGMIGKITVQ